MPRGGDSREAARDRHLAATLREARSELKAFRDASLPVQGFRTRCCEISLHKGQGFPGRAWKVSGVAYGDIRSLTQQEYPMQALAASSGLNSVVAVPVVASTEQSLCAPADVASAPLLTVPAPLSAKTLLERAGHLYSPVLLDVDAPRRRIPRRRIVELFLPADFSMPLGHAVEVFSQRCVGAGFTVLSQPGVGPSAGSDASTAEAAVPTPGSQSGVADAVTLRTSFTGEVRGPSRPNAALVSGPSLSRRSCPRRPAAGGVSPSFRASLTLPLRPARPNRLPGA